MSNELFDAYQYCQEINRLAEEAVSFWFRHTDSDGLYKYQIYDILDTLLSDHPWVTDQEFAMRVLLISANRGAIFDIYSDGITISHWSLIHKLGAKYSMQQDILEVFHEMVREETELSEKEAHDFSTELEAEQRGVFYTEMPEE